MSVKTKDKPDRKVSFFVNHDWKKQRNGFQIGNAKIDLLLWTITMRVVDHMKLMALS